MSEAPTQPVAQPAEAQAQPAAEATSAQTPDLNSFLQEFEAETKAPTQPAPAPAATQPTAAELLQMKLEIDDLRREKATEREKADIEGIIKDFKGDKALPDYVVNGWINHVAGSDQRIVTAFNQRHTNPQAWKKVQAGLKAQFENEVKKLGGTDTEVTSDRMAVAAAVKGASSTKAPEAKAPDYGRMSDAEFRELKKNLGVE